MKLLVHFVKSAASGFFIVIGCTALIASGNLYIGAVLFTVALCSICNLETPLYTGAVGYAKTLRDFGTLAVTLLGNIAGCTILGIAVGAALPEISANAADRVLSKAYPVHTGFILAFVCGLLMYTAVHTFRTRRSYAGVLTCVPAFIIAGFEHSVAYMGYIGLGHTVTVTVLVNLLVFIIGNGAGALVLNLIVRPGKDNGAGSK